MKRIFLIALFLILSACQPTQKEATPTSPPAENNITLEEIPLDIGFGVDGGWYEIYFTDPTAVDASSYRGGPDLRLAEAINNARLSVDVAVYSMSLWSIRDALINAHHRGVDVRVVMESSNIDKKVPQALISAGIPVIGDEGDGLMHDKFVIIDGFVTWTGSWNGWTSGCCISVCFPHLSNPLGWGTPR